MVLTVIFDQHVRLTRKWSKSAERRNAEETLDGFGVQVRNKNSNRSDNQIWIFTTDGYIVSKARPDHALTSAATIIPGDDETFVATGIRVNEEDPFVSFAAICPKCESDSPFVYRQR